MGVNSITISLIDSFIYLFLRLIYFREHGGGVEREFQADFLLSMEPDVGLYLTTLRSLLESKSRVSCLTNYATQMPPFGSFIHQI